MNLKQKILDYLPINPTFVELTREIPEMVGNKTYSFQNGNQNIVLWTNLSDEAIDSLEELKMEKKFIPEKEDVATYIYDGQVVDLPIWNSKKKSNSEKSYWFPIRLKSNL